MLMGKALDEGLIMAVMGLGRRCRVELPEIPKSIGSESSSRLEQNTSIRARRCKESQFLLCSGGGKGPAS